MKAPSKVRQKRRGFCYAACIMSLDNMWGGKWNQDSKDINQSTGYVTTTERTKVKWTAGTASLSGIKSCIDGGNYALVHMKGGYEHWVIAYAASAATEEGIMVMDPVGGNLITLKAAMNIEKSHNIVDVRKAIKR